MAEERDIKLQERRITRLALEAVLKLEHQGSLSAVYDVDEDRFSVRLGVTEVAVVKPKDFFLSDDELRQKIAAGIINQFGDNRSRLKPPITPI